MNDWICLEGWRIAAIIALSMFAGGFFALTVKVKKPHLSFLTVVIMSLAIASIGYLINMVTPAGGGG